MEGEGESFGEYREEFSHAGYTNLKGILKRITIIKVCSKLGIAIDGGANTRQKAIIVRMITPDACAALTSDLKVGHQILTVNGETLKNLSHKDAVTVIKTAFCDAPMESDVVFEVLQTEQD